MKLERSLAPVLVLALASACHRSHGPGGSIGGGGSTPLSVDFALRTDLQLGSAFLGDLLHEDIDGDGVLDLVEGNFGTQFVTIAFGHLDGSFTTVYELATKGHSFRLASADLDGNGLKDVAVACGDWIDGANQAVQVFLQGPNAGDFGPTVVFDLDTDPKDIASAPISGTAGAAGPDELFVALRDQKRILRLVLSGGALVDNGSLDSANLGLGGPFSLAVLDVGGDGVLDLVMGEDNPGIDRVLEFPRTAGGFQPAQLLLEPLERPIVDATGDMDGNGFDDLAIAQLGANDVFLLAGDASGLSTAHALDFGGETTSLLFADLDGDGLAEAIATVFLQESVEVRHALAPFVWDEPVNYNVGLAPRAIGVVEIPGDSVKDLLCANAQDLSILHGRGDGSFRAATGAATREPPILVQTADLDADGDQDAVAITRFQETLVFLENRGGKLVTVNELDLQSSKKNDSGFLALADVDGDGDVDVLATVFEQDELRLYRNQGGPASFEPPAPGDSITVGHGPLGIALADLNGDQLLDVIVGCIGERSLQVLLGQGGGAFAAPVTLALDFAPLNLLAADFDGDGNVDVAATARLEQGEGLALFSGDGTGALAEAARIPLAGTSGGLAMGDLDEDGDLDLVVGEFDVLSSELHVLRNQGGLQFSAEELTLGPGPGTPLVVDCDDDGHLDLIVPSTDGELELAAGNGTGVFRGLQLLRRGTLSCPDGTVSATLTDLDGDHKPEILMVSPQAPFVWVAHNESEALVEE